MDRPDHYLPDGSPVYGKKSEINPELRGCLWAVLSVIGIVLLFMLANLVLKWIGAGFYVIPFPRF